MATSASRAQIAPSPKWVRVYFNGELIAESREMALLRIGGGPPAYLFPKGAVREEFLRSSGDKWNLQVGERVAKAAASEVDGYILFEWGKMDAWFEEDEEVHVHPRDPLKRIDIVHSSRKIEVVVADTKVAETTRPVLLFETGLPTRYYIPQQDTLFELFEPSKTLTRCAYKGEAHHFSVRIGEELHPDLLWTYRYSTMEAAKVQGLFCFYNEKVELYEDGQLLERPKTAWS